MLLTLPSLAELAAVIGIEAGAEAEKLAPDSTSRESAPREAVDDDSIGPHALAMKELRTEIDIAAPAEAVWAVLTDFAAFPQWNPFIQEASGERKIGGRLRIRVVPQGSKGMVFKPTVL